ncbi:glycosyltransferase [Lyngbya sp. PCC 8106]|uniref:glycosyltransferase family protein n=1 Tax=Lyngbya sp. (strain PCC 8106) TaxID=313612 RepID=UPI0000EAC7E2|nr:glycosyltransferase [Lyngbya sp. PCC 8106]EAW38823.1 hypothetical protein L8106_15450 [Lyngbya sp. PCC 8106]
MRIFLVCQQSLKNHLVPAYQFWEDYFKKGIEEAGHEWVEAQNIDWAEGLVYLDKKALNTWRDLTWSLTLSAIKKEHRKKPINLFLSYLFPKQVEPTALKEIQKLGIPCVNFFCDNIREFTKIPPVFYEFDLHWVPEFKAIKMYQKARQNYIYAPMPVWIPPEQRTWDHPEHYGVSFIGSRDIQREALLAQVLNLGISLEIRGSAWNKAETPSSTLIKPEKTFYKTLVNQVNFLTANGINAWYGKATYKRQTRIPDDYFKDAVKPKPDPQEYVNIIQQSRITLGINRYPSYQYPFSKPDTYSRMRDIEAPMMGACYLTEWTEGLEHLYELGEEIETYCTAEEMVDKIHKLEADPERRKKMRFQAQKRVVSQHTVSQTLDKIINKMGLKI